MAGRLFNITLLLVQAFWMVVVLPGHQRGMIVLGEDSCCTAPAAAESHAESHASCCATDDKPFKPGSEPSQERKSRCAVCYQAAGYDLPPVYAVDLKPTGLCELCRLIEPTKRNQLFCEPTYFANGPPAAGVLA